MLRLSTVAVWALAIAAAACSNEAARPESDAGFVYLDANEETGPVAPDGAGEAPPTSCAPIMTLVSPTAGCRADWNCGARGLYTFVCGAADGGASACFCIAADDTQASGTIDGCGNGPAGVSAAAVALCGWTFAGTAVSDGGAP